MDTNSLLSTIVLVAFIVTVVLAIGSYLAYKAREKRRPRDDRMNVAHGEPIFFERFFPQRSEPGTASLEPKGPAAG